MFVVDASITLEWLFPGQRTAVAHRAFERTKKEPVVVPMVWLLETQNAVLMKLRQRKISEQDALEMRLELALLSKRVDQVPDEQAVERIWTVATDQMMTIYDASYVELAQRLDLSIASSDAAVRAAAKALGLALI